MRYTPSLPHPCDKAKSKCYKWPKGKRWAWVLQPLLCYLWVPTFSIKTLGLYILSDLAIVTDWAMSFHTSFLLPPSPPLLKEERKVGEEEGMRHLAWNHLSRILLKPCCFFFPAPCDNITKLIYIQIETTLHHHSLFFYMVALVTLISLLNPLNEVLNLLIMTNDPSLAEEMITCR